MKNRILYLLLAALPFFMGACEEIPPVLNPVMGGGGGTGGGDLENQQRQVIIEEFTGVRCVNCPAGAQAINTLRSIHGERLIPVSIHAGFFAQPYSESAENYANAEGNALQSYLGEPIGYPTAVVNRRQFDGESSLQVGQGTWAGYVVQELAAPPRVKLAVEHTYNEASRQVSGSLAFHPQENITEPDVRYTILVVQDSIADYQLTPDGVNPLYMHRHVFRGAVTSTSGTPVGEALNEGQVVNKTFSYTLPAHWRAEKCYLVLMAHLSGDIKDVLQAIETKVIE